MSGLCQASECPGQQMWPVMAHYEYLCWDLNEQFIPLLLGWDLLHSNI